MEQIVDIGQRIRKIMENLTLQEFADSIGVSVRALSNYLNGRTPKKAIIKNICDNYGVSATWLRSGEGPMYAKDSAPDLSDMSEVLEGEGAKHPIENTRSDIEFFSDTSEKLRLRQKLEQSLEKMVELQERLLSLTEQNAELRLQLERRDLRIRELEKENAGLREANKGAAAVHDNAEWQAS